MSLAGRPSQFAGRSGRRGMAAFLRSWGRESFESRTLHSPLCFRVFHEGIPYEAGTSVFDHHHRDSGVDSDHVVIVPTRQGVECIDESIAAPGAVSVAIFNGAK